MRKIQFTYLSILVLCLVILQGMTVLASPGAALLPRSEALQLNLNQDTVLWNAENFVLVIPGTDANETNLFPPKKNVNHYLVSESRNILEKNYQPEAIRVIDSIWSVIEVPKVMAPNIILPENSIYLGYPGSSIRENKTSRMSPEDVTWSQQIQDIVDNVSETQLMADLTALVDFQTRNSYAQGCWDSAEWLHDRFVELGYNVELHEHDRQMGPNVIAEKTGISLPEEIVIICGHFDSISLQPQTLAPGADDNGTGTAATLNAARVMADLHFERTIRFICFSGEEQGLWGSQDYAQTAAANNDQIIAVVNLDMIGYVDQTPEELEIIGNNASEDLVDTFIECANAYTTLPTNKVLNGNLTYSDHSPFWNQGYQALLGIEDSPLNYPEYHTIYDTVDKVTPSFFTESSKAAIATVAHLAEPMDPQVYIYEVHWDDSAGDNDGYLDPNETVNVWVKLINNADIPSGDIQLTLICLSGSQYVLLNDNNATVSSLQPGEQTDTADQPFVMTVRENTPEFTDLTCIAALNCTAPHSSGHIFHGTITSYEWNDEAVLYSMNDEPMWTSDGDLWQWGEPQGMGGSNHGYSDPSSGYTGTNVLGTNLNGDYPANIMETVTSPVLDLTDIRHAELRFKRWLNVENPQYDRARAWIINGDGTHQVWGNSAETTDNQWVEMQINISELVDGRDDVQIAFSLQSDGGWEYSGWNLDDIRIAGLTPGTAMPTPTPDPTQETIGIDLKMSDVSLQANDPFLLTMDWWNNSLDNHDNVPVFIILNIQGAFWYWPDWSTELAHDTMNLPANGAEQDIEILSFTWPDINESLSGLEFIGAFTTEDYQEILGSHDIIQWEFL